MKVYKFWPPYQASGKTTFPETSNRSGVYIIKENDKIVYIGFSGTNLYRTLYRHFQRWNHKTQSVTTYFEKLKVKKYLVRVVLCTPTQAAKLEKALIIKHKPRDNREKYRAHKIDFEDKQIIQKYENEFAIIEAPF